MGKSKYLDFKVVKKYSRKLRSNLTESEKKLWKELRNRKLEGYKFLRQHPIIYKADYKGLNYFVADFYCNEKKAVIELDGPIHDSNVEYDEFRDSELKDLGIKILRIKNEDLNNMKEVLQRINTFLNGIIK
jgi:very-short-patch-repair endonuclease